MATRKIIARVAALAVTRRPRAILKSIRGSRRSALALVVWAAFQPLAGRAAEPTYELWPTGAPGAVGSTVEDRPAITVFLPPPGQGNGAGVLVCPGGGFTVRCTDFEGVQIAQWFQARGVAAFVLRYRIVPLYTLRETLQDARRGMEFVRGRAAEFHVAPNRIGIIGFSAGAQLAANASMKARAAVPDATDPLERISSRPDFLVLAYGDAGQRGGPRGALAEGLTDDEAARAMSPAENELASAPPTFMFCTSEDFGHATGMADLYGRLLRAGVPAEAHFYQSGEHGVGFAQGDPVLGEWPEAMFRWLRGGGFLTDAPRIGARGVVKVDGEPLARGYVLFTPLDSTNAPPITGFVFNTGDVLGQFVIPPARGLCPGRYRVEVRQNAARFASNSRDPVLKKMTQKARSNGKLDEADHREWVASARLKDFSRSLDRQGVFLRKHPGDKSEMIVQIQPGPENRVDIEVFSH